MNISSFKRIVWDFYKKQGRHHLPWRKTRDPYNILVSEIMLQQTQVDRVIPKYQSFLKKFPTVHALAKAKAAEVLKEWQGLGYNRRGIHLKRASEIVAKEYQGKFPKDLALLLKLPGVGPATAGDLLAFAWNVPVVVTETNIRTVFMHHFFSTSPRLRGTSLESCKIYDKQIIPLIGKTLDRKNPREWYYALMDYGSHLKKTHGNNIARSAEYKKQSKFKGSNRELRSHILRLILQEPRTEAEVLKLLDSPAPLIRKNITAMKREGLIANKRGRMSA